MIKSVYAQSITLLMLLLFVFILFAYHNRINDVEEVVGLQHLPREIDGWMGIDDHFTGKGIYDFIGADETLLRQYKKNNMIITLYVGYYSEIREGKRPHAAKGCYTGQGWSILEDDIVCFQESDCVFKASRMLLRQNDRYQKVFYWFQNKKGDFLATEKSVNFELFLNKILFRQADIAFVRVSSFVPAMDADFYEKKMRRFISILKPYLSEIISERSSL